LSQSRNASQWIAAMILKVTSGSEEERAQLRRRGQHAPAAVKGRGEQGPSWSVFRMRSLTLSPGGEMRK
jgi:hypothetical protein